MDRAIKASEGAREMPLQVIGHWSKWSPCYSICFAKEVYPREAIGADLSPTISCNLFQ